ncbi:MAG: hypothetical protein CR986_07560 [Ignavibacteriae bacterium]|nr:MAG: hypothetical protein CR986_07560 [Ignavibacteriota bacterium]
MKKTLQILSLFILTTFLNAQELKSVYVLSEGGFSAGTSKLSKLVYENSDFRQSIFNPDNIGLYPDGLMLYGENLYLTEQGSWGGSGKIYKLDTAGTVLESEEVANNPYSFAISNEKIYLTNGPISNVTVLNLNDFSKVKDIKVGAFPQNIVSKDSLVFVANKSVWGGASDSTVSVINTNLDSVVATIIVRKNPTSVVIKDGFLLVGCPGDSAIGMIYKVDLSTLTKVDSFDVPSNDGYSKDIVVEKNTDNIFFASQSGKIIKLDMATRKTEVVVEDTSLVMLYGYNYDSVNKEHYLLDAKDFKIEGQLTVYDSTGKKLNNYTTGIAPRRIVFEYKLEVSVKESQVIAADFKLEQNYPNPFNPTTVIEYTIPSNMKREMSNVKLIVYDILGNKVATLVDKQQSSGSYQVKFDGSNLASGIYFYKLQTGNFNQIRKMMLLK